LTQVYSLIKKIMQDHIVEKFTKGIHNLLPDEVIPKEAFRNGKNWLHVDGHVELIRGRSVVGQDGSFGKCLNNWFGSKADGTPVHYRKIDTKIQYYNTSTNLWVDVVTGLNDSYDIKFQNYASLAGNFVFATGYDGIFKFVTANPDSYISLYNSSKNFKGFGTIDKGRMLLSSCEHDKTGLYGSYIDAQDSAVYTTITNEVLATGDGVLTSFSGTLAFKAGGATRNCFGITIDQNPAGITAKDNYLGIITGTGVSGTINYVTGAWTLVFTAPVANLTQIRATYQYEDSNEKGITDFTKSSPRQASQGFVLRQDEGGDAILNCLVGIDGNYYSMKKFSIYRYSPDDTDTKPLNEVYRKDVGIPNWACCISTKQGIVFVDTSKPDKPYLTILEKDPLGSDLIPKVVCAQFAFENYNYDSGWMESWGKYVVIACKTNGALSNDTLLVCDVAGQTVDITSYGMYSLSKSRGVLYGGAEITQNVYKLFDGWDDDNYKNDNFLETKGERMDSENLKKVRRLRLSGRIAKDQYYDIYADFDDSGYQLVGRVSGTGTYVDFTGGSVMVGSTMVGEEAVGGGISGLGTPTYKYFIELKFKTPKFRKRNLKFVAGGFGFVSIAYTMDHDIMTFEPRIPKKYRTKTINDLVFSVFGPGVSTSAVTYDPNGMWAIFGSSHVDGSWKLIVDGNDFKLQRLESGVWVDKQQYIP